MTRLLAKVYRSPRQEGMYLYVASSDELKRVPEGLLEHFGKPLQAMTLLLSAERKLAHADAQEVIKSIEERGFYLQMASVEEHQEMTAVAARNDKLPRLN